jgi:hypothetical protein
MQLQATDSIGRQHSLETNAALRCNKCSAQEQGNLQCGKHTAYAQQCNVMYLLHCTFKQTAAAGTETLR